jgi:uncharacterized membrane protein YccC
MIEVRGIHPRRILTWNRPGIHYAVRIFMGTTMLWVILRKVAGSHAIWAVISLIIVTEPDVKTALATFKSRISNTLLGCAAGLFCLLVAGPHDWMLPVALTVTAAISTWLTKMEVSWRIAPIAAAIIMASGLAAHSKASGLEAAFQRTGEVFLGGATALVVAWALSRFWMPDSTGQKQQSLN